MLRSLAAHAGVDEVWTVGDQPDGITPDRHIHSPNDLRPYQNIAAHLTRVCSATDEPFIWCDDDTFTIRPWTPAVYVRPFSIDYFFRRNRNRGMWSVAVRNSIKVMTDHGYDPTQVPCGTTHRPWLVDPARAEQTIEALAPVGGGSFKAMYVAGLTGVVESDDPKLRGRGMPKPDADVISVFNDSWRYNAGRIIRDTFPTPSRWEDTPNADTVGAAGGRGAGRRRRHRR